MTTYTQKCGQCGQDWSGYGTYCNDCQRMKLLKEANEAQAESMKAEQRFRDEADDRRRDAEYEQEKTERKAAYAKHARDTEALLVEAEAKFPGYRRAYHLQQDIRSTAFNAAFGIAKTNQQVKIKNTRIINVICWLAVLVGGLVYYAPWTTDWMPLKLFGLFCYATGMLTSYALTHYPIDFDFEDGPWLSTVPSVTDVYKKMLADDKAKAEEAKFAHATAVAIPACIKCGNALIPNAKFCKHCGTNVDAPHIATLPIAETSKIAAVSTTASSKKIESEVVSNKVNSPSVNSVEVNNKKTGISGTQIAIGLVAIILLAIFAYITKSNNSAAPAVVTPAPAVVVAPPPVAAPVVTPQAEVDPAQQAALKQAEEDAAQKKFDEEEAKRIAAEEKTTAIAVAKEQKQLEHDDKLLQVQQQKDERIRRAEELKKAQDELALAKLKAAIQQAKRDEELARIEALSDPVAQKSPNPKPAPEVTQGKFQAKFRGFLGLKVATRYYATEDMKNEAMKLWKAEGKILETDGSITIVKQENKAAEALGQ